MSNTLHVAIIPDGNRRWAKERGLKGYYDLYQIGIDGLLETCGAAFENGVTHLSLWGSSHANMSKRTSDFVQNLDRVFHDNIQRFATHPVIAKFDVRIDIIGEWQDSFSPETVAVMKSAIADTSHRQGSRLTLLLDYSGVREREFAVKSLLRSDTKSTNLLDFAWTSHLPPVDMIIRTGSWKDPHNSEGFMSLLVDNTQYFYPEMYWPDFDEYTLKSILADFKAREKRSGK